MTLKIIYPQIKIDSSFPRNVNIESIIQFIKPIPNLNSLIPSPMNNFKQVFVDSKQNILSKKNQLEEFKSDSLEIIHNAESYLSKTNFHKNRNEYQSYKIDQLRKYQVYQNKYNSLLQALLKARQNFLMKSERLLSDLLQVCEWFISKPQPFYIDVECAFPMNHLFFIENKTLVKKFNRIENAFQVQYEYLSLFPDQIFTSDDELNRDFLKNAIQEAIGKKKNNLNYFEPLKCEESLFIFFQSKSSPIFEKVSKIKSIKNFNMLKLNESDQNVCEAEEFVSNWIRESAAIILNFVEKNNANECSSDERNLEMDFIGIFLVRFIFDFTYPSLEWHPFPDPSFSHHIEKLSIKTARENNVSLDFIPPELADAECTKIFERNSLSRAPVEWITSAQFEVCPLRAAYCMFKVHESLTIMATLDAADNKAAMKSGKSDKRQAGKNEMQINKAEELNSDESIESLQNVDNSNLNMNSNKESLQNNENYNLNINSNKNKDSNENTDSNLNMSQNENKQAEVFFSKVPGFDDIFNFWVCLICSAKLADARGLNKFIKKWSSLPGFCSMIKLACTYFEAAITHIESGEAD